MKRKQEIKEKILLIRAENKQMNSVSVYGLQNTFFFPSGFFSSIIVNCLLELVSMTMSLWCPHT
jgi:hypothetical protein